MPVRFRLLRSQVKGASLATPQHIKRFIRLAAMAIVGVLAIIHFSFGRDLTLQEQLMSGLVAALALLLGDMLLGWRRVARRSAIPSVPLKSFYNLFNTVDDFCSSTIWTPISSK